MSAFVALSRHEPLHCIYPLSGAKRTRRRAGRRTLEAKPTPTYFKLEAGPPSPNAQASGRDWPQRFPAVWSQFLLALPNRSDDFYFPHVKVRATFSSSREVLHQREGRASRFLAGPAGAAPPGARGRRDPDASVRVAYATWSAHDATVTGDRVSPR